MAKRKNNVNDDNNEPVSSSKRSRVNGKAVDDDREGSVDDGPEDDEFEAMFEDRVRAAIESKKTKEGNVAQCGIIQSVQMYNFMCHKNLSFNFGPQINFIIGQNGSGKSAVLSAITIALGGKASTTGRGSGLKSFIKEGEPAAEVIIKIRNKGEDAYKFDTYGDNILVTRKFTREGNSTLKISNDKGRVVSTKKSELSAICDYFNIQVDNPMNVLSQDAARHFLSSAQPGDKYEFFLKGTQLLQLHDEYDKCLENVTKTGKIIAHKSTLIPDLKKAVTAARTRLGEANKALEQRGKLDDLKVERVWSYYVEKENELTDRVKAVEQSERKITKAQSAIDTANGKVEEADQNVVAVEAQLVELGDETELRNEINKLQKEITENRDKIRKLNDTEQSMNREIDQLNRAIVNFDKKIADEEAKLQQNTQATRDERDRRLQEVESECEDVDKQIKDINEKLRNLEDQKQRIKRGIEDMGRERAQMEQTFNECHAAIDNCSRQKKDKLAAFVNDYKTVDQKIDQQRWYGEKPVGPLGQFVSITDPKWADVMRTQLGALMQAYAITDARDRPALKNILHSTRNGRAGIVVSAKDLFNYQAGEPNPQLLTVLRALTITNEYVKRILINQQRVERTLLANTRAEAQALVDRFPGGAVAWTADLFRVQNYGDGGATSVPLNRVPNGDNRQQMFTTDDFEAQIERWRQKGRETDTQYKAVKEKLVKMQAELDQCHLDLQRHHNECRPLLPRLEKARNLRQTLITERNNSVPVNIASLYDAKKEAEEEKNSIKQQFAGSEQEKQGIQEAQRPLVDKQKTLKAQLAEFDEKRQEIHQSLEAATEKRVRAQSDLKHYKKKLGEEQEKLDKLKQEADATRAETERMLNGIHRQGAKRVENPRKLQEVERLIASTEKALASSERRQGASIDQLEEDVEVAERNLVEASKEIKEMGKLNQILKHSVQTRMGRWHEFRRHIALRTKVQFQYYLSNRGYYGKVLFDHEKGDLQLKVQTDDQASTQGANRDKDPKSLSGGEKSFATICLLLALWEAIGCPIRCLDEFDVFMDAVNRRISTKMMIDVAASSDSKQYILITPQDISSIALSASVKINRMPDPERGQARLNFPSQNQN